jgi:hypothetical protein
MISLLVIGAPRLFRSWNMLADDLAAEGEVSTTISGR